MRAAKVYQRVSLESASPTQVLDALYGRLERDLDDGRAAIVDKRLADKGVALSHALAIVHELEAALDPKTAPDVCQSLASLYDFVRERIQLGNVKLDVVALDEAKKIVSQLRLTFADAARVAR